MTKERFNQINSMTEDERLELSKEEIAEYYDYIANSSNNTVSIPTEVYIEGGINVATETLLITTGASEKLLEVSKDLSKGITPTQTVGTVGKVAVFLSMATNIYSMVKGEFEWNLTNTVNLLTSTLACLVLLGVNVACLGALATILASNPFTIGLAVVCLLINYFSIGEMAEKLKKTYMSCFNSYRRIYKLCNWANTNEVIYQNFNSVLDFAKEEILKIKDEFINSEYYKTNMRRKIFVGADFNSFVLFNNIITFIQSKQELSTAKDGVYNEYIDFCSIQDYIDTHEIIKQDLARIEYFILQNDLKALKDFVISVDFLTGYFDTYKLNSFLTNDVKKDIEFVLKCVKTIKSAIGEQGLLELKSENQQFKNIRNPEELFNSIYSYLIYSNAMRNSPFTVCKTLLNPEYYSSQNIYEYVSAFSEYPVYLFSNWYFYFGNIMFNDIYIEKYKTELISAYNSNKSLYDENFYKDLIKNIDSFNDFKNVLMWLYAIKEFLQNIYDKKYLQYLPYFATSFTQTGITEDGKTLYNYYLPDNEYAFDNIQSLIKRFVNNMKSYGYDRTKFSSLLDNFWLLTNYNIDINVSFIDLSCIDSLIGKWDLGGILGKFKDIDDNIYDLLNTRTYTYTYTGTNVYGGTEQKTGYIKYENKNLETDFNTFKNMYNIYSSNSMLSNGFLSGAYIRSVRGDGKFAFGKTKDISFDLLEYLGSSKDINDFYYRILDYTKDIKYLYAYMVLIFDDRWSNEWGGSFFEVAYLLAKSQKLRELFFNGYNFKSTHNRDEYLKSLWQFIKGERNDVVFYWADNYCPDINLHTFTDDMIKQSVYKKDLVNLYNDFKIVYAEFRNKIKTDIKFAQDLINEQIANYDEILNKYPQFDSSLSYSYTGKYDVYLWNIYKLAMDLGRNNKSYLTNIERHLVPVYKLKDGYIQLETYFSPMFILMSAKDDTDLSQSYYLINQEALNYLFNIGNEKFEEKIKEYKDLVSLTIQPEIKVIDHKQIMDDISQNIQTMYSLNKEEMIELLGSQEDEYILIQNLLNQEILKKAKENDVVEPEVINAIDLNSYLANKTAQEIKDNKFVLDKNKIIKYAMGVGLALFFINRGK